MYDGWGSRKEKNEIYKIAKTSEWKSKDIDQVKCIKSGDERILRKGKTKQKKMGMLFWKII